MSSDRPTQPATRLIHAGRTPADHHGTVNPPIHRASTIILPDMDAWRASSKPDYTGYRYGLTATPTSRGFERAMAEFYGAEACVAVCSGLAMITVALMALTEAGDEILVADHVYGPTRSFCDTILRRFGVATRYYDPLIGTGIAELITGKTALILTESPGSMTFEVQDIPAITAAAHERGVKVVIDNTWATALAFNPFAHGVDVVTEATTKYVAGHSDVLSGVILSNKTLGRRIRLTAKGLGICCGPEEMYLAERGLRTLALRYARSGETGLTVAHWLKTRPEVARVLHPALPDCPGHTIWQRDFTGAAGLFSIVLKQVNQPALDAFINSLRLFAIGASWGGYESLVLTNDISKLRSAVPWTEPGPVVRFHTGLEDPNDLIADLADGFQALAEAN